MARLFGWPGQQETITLPALIREVNRRLKALDADFESGTIVLRDADGEIAVVAGTPLRVQFDDSNYVDISVSATGVVTVNATGSGAAVTFSDNVTLSADLLLAAGTHVTWTGRGDLSSQAQGELRLQYDADNRLVATVSSAGAVTYDAVGASASHAFSDAVTVNSTLSVAAGSTSNAHTVTTTGAIQQTLRYDASNRLDTAVSSGGIPTLTPTGAKLILAKDMDLASGKVYKVNDTQVVSAQGAAVADASGGATIDAEARTAINTLLARLRTHGLIAT